MKAMRGAMAAVALWATSVLPVAGQARQGMVSLDEGRLFYEVVGTGDPIIVVHGGPGLDHNYLRPGLDVLAASHTLIYYDQRGTGRSVAPLDEAHINLDAFVEDIDELRMALGYDQITVLGHSFGGLIAMAYARAHPDRTHALILMDSSEPGHRFADETARRQAAARTPEDSTDLAAAMADPGYAARDPEVMSRIYRIAFRGTMHVRDRVDELHLDLLPATAKDGCDVARLLGGSIGQDFDWWPTLGEITAPTLVLQGRWDVPPQEMGRELAAAFPDGRFVALDSGHLPYVEDPQGLAEAVSAFLTGLSR